MRDGDLESFQELKVGECPLRTGMVGKGLREGGWNSLKIRSPLDEWNQKDQPCMGDSFLGFEA